MKMKVLTYEQVEKIKEALSSLELIKRNLLGTRDNVAEDLIDMLDENSDEIVVMEEDEYREKFG